MPARNLFLIRIALTLGIIGFCVVSWIVRHGDSPPATPPGMDNIRLFAFAVAAGAGAALVALRARFGALEPARRAQLVIVAWAAGEAAALAGIVGYYLSGDEVVAAPGLLAYVIALQLYRVPEA